MSGSRIPWGAILTAIVIVVAAACTGSGPDSTSAERSPRAPSAIIRGPGGQVVFGAEEWPECLNPLTTCTSRPWDWYSVLEHVLPRAMQLDAGGNYIASPLLVEAPSLENGGLVVGPPFTLKFRIRDQAVWDDGSPITSGDFLFTWKAIMHTTNSTRVDKYRAIRSIDTTDPKMVIMEFREPTAHWPELFGGSRGFILKRGAFPRSNPTKPNLGKRMLGAISFSGGPWILKEWSRSQAVLVRNGRYFGRRARLPQLIFVPRTEPSGEINALRRGEVSALFADTSWSFDGHPTLLELLGRVPNVRTQPVEGTRFEVLWFNVHAGALRDPLVRKALMYAVDRQAIVDGVVKPNNPRATVLDCGLLTTPGGPYCSVRPYDRYRYDPAEARATLMRAGYKCSSTPCTKGGKPLQVRYMASAASPLQAAIEEMVARQALEAGFELIIVNIEGGLPGDVCGKPQRIAVIQCADSTRFDGSLTSVMSCDAIPTEADDYEGDNRMGWCNPEADRLMRESDRELDPSRRLELLNRVHQIEADNFIGLPLFVLPVINAWRTDQIAGRIGLYSSTPYGMFFNMNEWHLADTTST